MTLPLGMQYLRQAISHHLSCNDHLQNRIEAILNPLFTAPSLAGLILPENYFIFWQGNYLSKGRNATYPKQFAFEFFILNRVK
jgi:hypothetical protein